MAIVRVALLLLGASVASAQVTCTSSYGDFWVRWCNDNCNHEPPFCPFPWCDCSADMPDGMSGNANLFPHIHDVDQCCLETSKIWFTAGGGDLYYVSFDGTSGNVGMPTLCYEFENAVDIAIEDNGGVFVADFNDAKVWFVNSDCSNRVVVTSWHEHQISAPISISIGSDPQCDGSGCARGLYVASSPNIMNFIRLDHDDNGMFVYNSHFFVKIFNRVEDFEFDKDTGDVWHIAGDSIYKNDQLWLDGQTFRIPDLMGLHVSPFGCGLFFSATDLNQVWRCTDLDDPTSCARFCQKAGIDTDTCEGTWNPWGVTGDCACNFYYANKAGGSISVLPYFTHNDTGLPTNFLVLDNIWHPQAVEVFVPKNCSLPLPSSTSSTTPSLSSTPSTTSSPSSTPSTTPSPSSTPSITPSPSITPTPSVTPIYEIERFIPSGVCSTDECLDPIVFRPNNRTIEIAWEISRSLSDGIPRVPDQTLFFNWNASDFRIFINLNEPNRDLNDFPEFIFLPEARTGYPNVFDEVNEVITAAVSCLGLEDGQTFGIAWLVNEQQGPCIIDPFLGDGRTYCADIGAGATDAAADWRDKNNNTVPSDARFLTSTCPTPVG